MARCKECKEQNRPRVENEVVIVGLLCAWCNTFYNICEVCGNATYIPIELNCHCIEQLKQYKK